MFGLWIIAGFTFGAGLGSWVYDFLRLVDRYVMDPKIWSNCRMVLEVLG